MSKWEYKTLPQELDHGYVNDMDLDKRLNELGAEGWELIAVSPVVVGGETKYLTHHFRRPQEERRAAGFRP